MGGSAPASIPGSSPGVSVNHTRPERLQTMKTSWKVNSCDVHTSNIYILASRDRSRVFHQQYANLGKHSSTDTSNGLCRHDVQQMLTLRPESFGEFHHSRGIISQSALTVKKATNGEDCPTATLQFLQIFYVFLTMSWTPGKSIRAGTTTSRHSRQYLGQELATEKGIWVSCNKGHHGGEE